MTLTEVKNFYGSLDNAAKAINVGSGILGFTEHLAPMIQMMFYSNKLKSFVPLIFFRIFTNKNV